MPLYISEHPALFVERGHAVPALTEPALATQTRTVSGTSAQSSAFNASTRLVELHATEILSFKIGADPTATTSDMRMAAGERVIRWVQGGHKVAAITNT